MLQAYLDSLDSPIGALQFATTSEGALLGLHFLDGHYPLTLQQELERDGYELTQDLARSEQALMIGRPTAARAVGRANATNRIPLVIPCHRVLGADGSLTGFAGGLHLKERLLAFEAAHRLA
jgi:O-6-methylguanine DNA methyltransferase